MLGGVRLHEYTVVPLEIYRDMVLGLRSSCLAIYPMGQVSLRSAKIMPSLGVGEMYKSSCGCGML